jgi:predicted Zn-dependent peptidase
VRTRNALFQRLRAATVLALTAITSRALAQQGPARQPAVTRPTAPATQRTTVTVPPLRIERYTLDNGLEVILHEDHRAPLVTVNIWYHVGAKDEPAGRNGFAHLFEHLMFQGSRHVPEDTFFLHLERIGATSVNGTTGDDRTNYFETVPSGRLATALWLESDRMGFLLDHVNQSTFESQRDVVLNEYRQNYENAPYGSVWQHLHRAVFPVTHPYHRIPIGTPEDLNRATLEDVRRFFRIWYAPNNATLVLAGDIDPAETRRLVQQYFGPIPRGPDVPRRPAPAPVQLTSETRVELEAGVELPRIYFAWPTPKYFAPGDAELDLVANILSNGASSRLFRKLVREQQIASDVAAFQSSMELASMFVVMVTGRPGQSVEALIRATDGEIDALRTQAPSVDELERARIDLTTSLLFSIEAMPNRADRLNLYRQHVGEPNFFAQDIARYDAASPEDVTRTVNTYLPRHQRVVLTVTPTPGAPVSGRLRNQPSSQHSAIVHFDDETRTDPSRSSAHPAALPQGGSR